MSICTEQLDINLSIVRRNLNLACQFNIFRGDEEHRKIKMELQGHNFSDGVETLTLSPIVTLPFSFVI